MSGFFGIFRPQGGPVDLKAFEQMKTAMHREGFDGMETHVEDKIAMGHLMLRVSPESKYDRQPLKSSCGNYLLVGHFRLDYRDELSDKLVFSWLSSTPDYIADTANLSFVKEVYMQIFF
jgi:asparagine synthase (glutamine-hydrolysing)